MSMKRAPTVFTLERALHILKKNTLIDCVCVSVSMLGGGGGHRYDCTICSSKMFKSTWVVIFFHNMYGCVFNMRVVDIFSVYGVCM